MEVASLVRHLKRLGRPRKSGQSEDEIVVIDVVRHRKFSTASPVQSCCGYL